MAVKTLFVDPTRCIGCRACEAACRECDSHKGESMIMVDYVDRGFSVATQREICRRPQQFSPTRDLLRQLRADSSQRSCERVNELDGLFRLADCL